MSYSKIFLKLVQDYVIIKKKIQNGNSQGKTTFYKTRYERLLQFCDFHYRRINILVSIIDYLQK